MQINLSGLVLEPIDTPDQPSATVSILHEIGEFMQINLVDRDGATANLMQIAVEDNAIVLRLWDEGNWVAREPAQVIRVASLGETEEEAGN